jgi:asparagine synthase (glutamine-hydrolysing)
MCGVAGVVGIPDPVEGTERVRSMVDALARRGPDAEGLERWHGVVLGHRRLSIFDLSDLGRQPMVAPDGTVAVVFNGAIYNFRPLRETLTASGYRFKSATDTEVLIHGYREWGIDGLVSRIQGMFAFGIWDERLRTLFLVRDRLGVKPLLYVTRGTTLAFASTARALRAAGFADEIDAGAVAEFLEFGYVTDERSIFAGVSKVPAASIAEWSSRGFHVRSYWRPPAVNPALTDFPAAVAECERLLLRAVERRLQADVPVGALLSGGIDSSLICWAIAALGGDVTAYTVATPGDPDDETADARQTARELKIAHEVRPVSAADDPDIHELVAAYAEPFACASALGMLRISRVISEHAKVLLTGDGGDDVFLGYPEHRHLWAAENVARVLPSAGWWRTVRPAALRVPRLKRVVSFVDYAAGGLGAVVRAHDGLPLYQQRGILGERLADARIEQREIEPSLASARRVLTDFLEYDRHNRFVGEYLTKVDGATMHHGLEARSPFLDQDVWEFAASLPYGVRLRRGRSKAVLRELAARKIGPRVAGGPKRGFSIPVQRWIAGRWRATVQRAFRDSILQRQGWVRESAVQRELEEASRRGWAPKQLWYLFVLEAWLKNEAAVERTSTPQATSA